MWRGLFQIFGVLAFSSQAKGAGGVSAIESFRELKDAKLLTPGQQGTQVIQLPEGRALWVEWDDLHFRGESIFIAEHLAVTMDIPVLQLGQPLDVVSVSPDHRHPSQLNSTESTLLSTSGTIVATLIASSTMTDVSDDLMEISRTVLDTIDDTSADEALDAEENEDDEDDDDDSTEEQPETPPENTAPEFGALPTTAQISESAAIGDSTGVAVIATDPEGETVIYTLARQQIEGAFSVEATTGEILVADPGKLDFETHNALEVTIAATDPDGAVSEQTVTIALLDDPLDTLSNTATNTVAHAPFSSGALVFSDQSGDSGTIFVGHAGTTQGDDESGSTAGLIELFGLTGAYFGREFLPDDQIASHEIDPLDALPEINAGELIAGVMTLTSTLSDALVSLEFDPQNTLFSNMTTSTSTTRLKTVDRDVSGVAEEIFTYADGTISKLSPSTFTQTATQFDLSAGDIIHFADLTGDDLAEVIIKQAGVGEAQVYEQLATGFATEPLAETLFTGIDLDILAGGRLLDLSVREHWADGNLNVMLLGTENTYLYDLT